MRGRGEGIVYTKRKGKNDNEKRNHSKQRHVYIHKRERF